MRSKTMDLTLVSHFRDKKLSIFVTFWVLNGNMRGQ